jgi:hypothetical protein
MLILNAHQLEQSWTLLIERSIIVKGDGHFKPILAVLLLSFAGLSPSIVLGSSIIQYTFSGINPGNGLQTFQENAPTFISPPPDQDFTKAELAYCTPAPCSDVLFDRNTGHGIDDIIDFTEVGGSQWFYDFTPGAFSALGIYTADSSLGNAGTLTVSLVTPEPASALLSFGGILFLVWLSEWRSSMDRASNRMPISRQLEVNQSCQDEV